MPPEPPPPADQTSSSQPLARAGSAGLEWTPPSVAQLQALLPHYEIIAMLGHGGMGAVYKGRQKSLDRLVAVKILPPGLDDEGAKFSERFKNEARLMAKLMHPGIVAVFDFGEIDVDGALAPASAADGGSQRAEDSPPLLKQLYIVMEYVDGTDLARMIQGSGKLPPDHALAITAHVCDALAYAHTNGVIHRDIKPANILINQQGQVKVADFGLAKMDDPAQGLGLTMTGMAMGTPDFVAPEALVMGATVDSRADLYAVGVMLYQMLTGEIPRGLFQMPGELSGGEIDPRFDHIIAKAMQTNRQARYQTASAIRHDLDEIQNTPRLRQDASQPVGAQPAVRAEVTPGPQSAGVPSAKSQTKLFSSIAAGIVVIGGALFMLNGGKPDRAESIEDSTGTLARSAMKQQPPQVAAPVAPSKFAASNSSDNWNDGMAEWWARPQNQATGRVAKEGTGWRVLKRGGITMNAANFSNVALRAAVRGRGRTSWEFQLRGNLEGDAYLARIEGSEVILKVLGKSVPIAELARGALPTGFDFDAGAMLEFRAQGDQLMFLFDGKPIAEAKDTTLKSGVASFYGAEGALIERLEYCRPAPAPPKGG